MPDLPIYTFKDAPDGGHVLLKDGAEFLTYPPQGCHMVDTPYECVGFILPEEQGIVFANREGFVPATREGALEAALTKALDALRAQAEWEDDVYVDRSWEGGVLVTEAQLEKLWPVWALRQEALFPTTPITARSEDL